MHGTALHEIAPARPPFRLGATLVLPASREITGPGGKQLVEPQVMRLLVELAAAGGGVVSREELLRRCWDGRFVGEDALHRAVHELRKLAKGAAAGCFEIETIPRTGYRLTGAVPEPVEAGDSISQPLPAPSIGAGDRSEKRGLLFDVSRRQLVLGGIAGAGVIGVLGWSRYRGGLDPARAAILLSEADALMQKGEPSSAATAEQLLTQASVLAPGDAKIWGRLALARAAQSHISGENIAFLLASSKEAARRALLISPDQPDAAAAIALMPFYFGDWLSARRQLDAYLLRYPQHPEATQGLADLLLDTGQQHAALQHARSLAARFPDAIAYRRGLAICLMAVGDVEGLGRTLQASIGQFRFAAPDLWFLVWNGRPEAAIARLDTVLLQGTVPLPEPMVTALRATLVACGSHLPADLDRASRLCMEIASHGHTGARMAATWLASVGAVDAAFEVAEGYLLERGPIRVSYNRSTWAAQDFNRVMRTAAFLFLPQTARMRADPRFLPLCRDTGLLAYWQRSKSRPDFLGNRSLPV